MVFYLSLFLLFCLFIYYNWKRRHIYKLSWSLHGSYSFPLIGDAYKFMCKDEDILDRLTDISNAYPSPIKFWFGPKLIVLITDPNHAEKVLTSSKFLHKGEIYRFMTDYVGEGLITASGLKWKRDRRFLSPYLSNKQVEKYFPCMVQNSEILAEVLEKEVYGTKFDIKSYLSRCLADIVNESFTGVKTQAQQGAFDVILKNISHLYTHVHSRMVKVWLYNKFLYKLSGYEKIGHDAFKPVSEFFRKGLDQMKETHAKETSVSNSDLDKSILNYMLYIRDKHPDFATDQELVDHLATFYTASEDTTTIICSFALSVFGMYPEIQDKIYQELVDIFGPTPRPVELEDIKRFDYFKMCVNEILRLFPIGPYIIRTATEDYEIDKWLLPKGSMIGVSIFNIQRHPKFWERPNEFYPEHFLPEAVANRHPYAFMPFSVGPRGCVGKPYANLAIYTILATVLQRYRFITEAKLEDRSLKTDISIRYKDNDYCVKIVPRSPVETRAQIKIFDQVIAQNIVPHGDSDAI